MYKIYDPLNDFRLIARAKTIQEAFEIARAHADEKRREQWIDDPRGVLCAVAQPA